MSDPPALGRVLLDNAIVLSQNAGLGGRMGLPAAAAGGSALLKVYTGCGLAALPGATIPAGVKRKNDGRFFYADDNTSETLAQMLEVSR